MKAAVFVVLALLALALVGFLGTSFDFAMFKFWAPKYENAKRQTFENTQSYVEGKREDLAKYHHEWAVDSSAENRRAIEALVRQQFANFDRSKVEDPELSAWLGECLNK